MGAGLFCVLDPDPTSGCSRGRWRSPGHPRRAPGGPRVPCFWRPVLPPGGPRDLLCLETVCPFVSARPAERVSSCEHLPPEKPFEIAESQDDVLFFTIWLHQFLKKEFYNPRHFVLV